MSLTNTLAYYGTEFIKDFIKFYDTDPRTIYFLVNPIESQVSKFSKKKS